MRAPRVRDAWVFTRPAGNTHCALVRSCWGDREGWTVWVVERHDWGRPKYEVRARMWTEPRHEITVSRPWHDTLHAAREYACGLVFVLSGSMSAEGLARRCPRGRYYRDGAGAERMFYDLPWSFIREP